MDTNRFDHLTRRFAALRSRRDAFRLLGGAALGGLAGLRGRTGLADHVREGSCTGRRCGDGRGGCCRGHKCCKGRCRNVRWDSRFCGDCKKACDTAQGEYCEFGDCVCGTGGVTCDGQCCQPEQACVDSACGKCPAGANACAAGADPLACAGGFEGEGACYCVTSVDNFATCSSLWGFCAECTGDDDCSRAMRRQAVCIEAAGCCGEFNKTRACVEATCYGGGPIGPAAQGTGREMQLRPDR